MFSKLFERSYKVYILLQQFLEKELRLARVQTPGAPTLRLVQEFGLIKLRWAKPVPGFLLETTTNVGNPASWTPAGGNPVENGADFEVAQPLPERHEKRIGVRALAYHSDAVNLRWLLGQAGEGRDE